MRHSKFFRLALWACTLALVTTLFHGFARLSEAGLGCPDWPGCYGKLFAPVTAQDLAAAKLYEEVSKDAEQKRALQEMTQRFLLGALGLVLIRLTVLGWQLKKRKRSQQVIIPLVTMALVFTVGAIGFLNYEYRYKPLMVMIQISGNVVTVLLLWWIVLREQKIFRSVNVPGLARRLSLRSLIALVLLALQVGLGAWSMVNYAGLACPDFPTCQGQWWPEAQFIDAFTLWQSEGLRYEGSLLSLPASTALNLAHRLGALLTLLYVGWFAFFVVRIGNEGRVCRYGLLILFLLVAVVTLGVMNVVMHLPLAVAVAHQTAAVLLLLSVLTLYHVVRFPRL